MAIACAQTPVELREVVLNDKPTELLVCSPKATVPVLQLPDGSLLEESLDIMYWALRQHDPEHWLSDDPDTQDETRGLIEHNDGPFKLRLDHYKYAVRHPEHPPEHYRRQAAQTLTSIEARLSQQPYLLGARAGLADIALFPFIRQLAFVDKGWFDQAPFPRLQNWLQTLLDSPWFQTVMKKQPAWRPGDRPRPFP